MKKGVHMADYSKRNRKVALSRWRRLHEQEKTSFRNTPEMLVFKSAICGFLSGDGSVQVRKEKSFFHYQVDFFPDDGLMLETYLEFIKKLYNKKPSIRRKEKLNYVRLTSKTVVKDLLSMSSFGIKKWRVPSELFKVSGSKEAWLRAFFSTEAYVSPKSIRLQTVNQVGMQQVSTLLKELGIEHANYGFQPKNKQHSKVFILVISEKGARRQFLDTIGFWHRRKETALRQALGL